MATEIDTSNRCCPSALKEQVMPGNAWLPSNTALQANEAHFAAAIPIKKLKNIVLNSSLIATCLIGITVISVGSAALLAIDGLARINRSEFLSKVPLTIALMVGAVSGVGIIFLMVKALLAVGDDFDFNDHR